MTNWRGKKITPNFAYRCIFCQALARNYHSWWLLFHWILIYTLQLPTKARKTPTLANHRGSQTTPPSSPLSWRLSSSWNGTSTRHSSSWTQLSTTLDTHILMDMVYMRGALNFLIAFTLPRWFFPADNTACNLGGGWPRKVSEGWTMAKWWWFGCGGGWGCADEGSWLAASAWGGLFWRRPL